MKRRSPRQARSRGLVDAVLFACVGAALTTTIVALYTSATLQALARRACTIWVEPKRAATSRRIR